MLQMLDGLGDFDSNGAYYYGPQDQASTASIIASMAIPSGGGTLTPQAIQATGQGALNSYLNTGDVGAMSVLAALSGSKAPQAVSPYIQTTSSTTTYMLIGGAAFVALMIALSMKG